MPFHFANLLHFFTHILPLPLNAPTTNPNHNVIDSKAPTTQNIPETPTNNSSVPFSYLTTTDCFHLRLIYNLEPTILLERPASPSQPKRYEPVGPEQCEGQPHYMTGRFYDQEHMYLRVERGMADTLNTLEKLRSF